MEDLRQKINRVAAHYLCDQPSGDLYDAYKELCDVAEEGNGSEIANNYVVVWQPLEHMSVDEMLELIDDSVNGYTPDTPDFIQKMDWELLRNQKRILLEETIDMEKKNAEYYKPVTDAFDGIIHLLDAIQDYAVDVLGIGEKVVFGDLDKEE